MANLNPAHPRLIISGNIWTRLARQRQADPLLDCLLDQLRRRAEIILAQPVVERRMEGRRLLMVSRDVLYRALTLIIAFRLGHDARFARRAVAELEAAASFSDWNPAHFLDVAEMTAALALGYDWLHDRLAPAQQRAIRQAIIEKGLRAATVSDPQIIWWKTSDNNWNQVCWGGLTLGALAVADDEPALAGEILAQAKAGIHHGLAPYAPAGVYPEGPMYWSYGTTYQAIMVSALQSALGTDWGLADAPGFRQSAEWQIHETGPGGRFFNFSDCRATAQLDPVLFWFATRYNDSGLLCFQKDQLAQLCAAPADRLNLHAQHLFPLAAVWWRGPSPAPNFAAAAAGDGKNPIAVIRSAWNDPAALYLAVKAGSAAVSHGHMDAGSFVLELDGQRWAVDLGMQEYDTLEAIGLELWGRDRWQVYRLNNHSHNTLTVNGRLHNPQGRAEITDFSPVTVSVNLTPVLGVQATRAFATDGTVGVQIHDRLDGLNPGDQITWQTLTPADVEIIAADSEALLRQNGKTLRVKFTVSGGAAQLTATPATGPNAYDAPNPGITRLALTVTAAAAKVIIRSSLAKE
ncbi:MAG: heparinase II/III family protein [Verrucomicrobiales bacterium]|nr:heparinase II/III family protein [Verrucomicrobiales bacterium]